MKIQLMRGELYLSAPLCRPSVGFMAILGKRSATSLGMLGTTTGLRRNIKLFDISSPHPLDIDLFQVSTAAIYDALGSLLNLRLFGD